VKIRRIVTAATTMVVAIVVALSVPISQLRTVAVVTTCCCPDPSHCHCPDHKPDHSKDSTLRACHRTQQEAVAPQLPAFAPPEVAIASAPAVVAVAIAAPIAAPHPAPAPRRPDAPS
jgi:hypothetical protein